MPPAAQVGQLDASNKRLREELDSFTLQAAAEAQAAEARIVALGEQLSEAMARVRWGGIYRGALWQVAQSSQ